MTRPLDVAPLDAFNQRLLDQVRPPEWVNPRPAARYNLVVVGGGTAGLVSAAGAAGLGAKVALVERALLGGDCLNVGCVPSKALIRAARAVAELRRAPQLGLRVSDQLAVDFPAVMERMRRLRAEISPDDSAARFQSLGVDVFFGQARFTGPATLDAAGQTLRFARAVIATGTQPRIPPIPGLLEAEPLTNESLFNLTELPPRLAVVGGGPIGVEMAQTFARFGAEVTLIEQGPRLLPRDDPDAARLIEQALQRDGVRLLRDTTLTRVERQGAERRLHLTGHEHTPPSLDVDALLLAVGRQPHVADLGLEAAGVEFDARAGVAVDDRLRTTNRRIFAAGDVCSRWKFTHAADAMARIVLANALFYGRARASRLVMPWCTYTDPELAHVGLSASEADQRGLAIDTLTVGLEAVHRAVLDDEREGFVRVHLARGTDRVLGATVVAAHAGELIGELSLVITGRLGLKSIARVIHPYPTQAEAIRRAADTYNRTRLTPRIRWLLERWFRWRR